MTIEHKVQLVEKLFFQLEKESAKFAQSSGLHCISGCGKCCSHPNIEASPLEFLPWAFHLFKNNEGENTLNLLSQTKNKICFIYTTSTNTERGSCNNYKYRGLICRLFGFAANTDKYGKLRLTTCKTIKENQTDNYLSTNKAITQGLSVPIFTEYYMQLNQIDFTLGKVILPVNEALKRALEEVLHYYAYHPFPDIQK
ncbi:YkgJ family cysteine cluster protein [uncultured Maribacter sp.]|uniref:YkgJ family cysteine cluster protein n=1 Tax=uncultured Maribacter sp. TaxID=431308 RepID=UPI00260E8EB2|nr:YkgJ family cysteine cluster protein [uncultured Maribacter sp.]